MIYYTVLKRFSFFFILRYKHIVNCSLPEHSNSESCMAYFIARKPLGPLIAVSTLHMRNGKSIKHLR